MISAILVNYFSTPFISHAVKSILSDTDPVEIIIIDNSCNEVEKRRLAEISSSNSNITLIFNKENTGFARACNLAYSFSKGDYILLLNPDAYLIPPCLSILVDFLDSNRNAAAASPMVFWDSKLQYRFPYYTYLSPSFDLLMKVSRSIHFTGRFISSIERIKNIGLWTGKAPRKTKMLHGGVFLIKKSAVEAVGGLFDDRFFLFYEDNDLCLRLRDFGFDLYIVPAARAVHNYRHTHRKLSLMQQSQRRFYEKHFKRSILRRITSFLPAGSLPSHTHYGTWSHPPLFEIPRPLQEGFLFEWSPDPFFIPAVGCFGEGKVFRFSDEIWELIEKGIYYGRFSVIRRFAGKLTTLQWEKI